MSAPQRIPYVEDNDIVREITSELLAQDQRQIVACATAEEALRTFTAEPFDLVITDVSLPVMSGMDLARSLLKLKPHVPIILASGYDLDFALENWAGNVRSIIKADSTFKRRIVLSNAPDCRHRPLPGRRRGWKSLGRTRCTAATSLGSAH
jgi:two-component system cell cycle response regulator CpdR